MIGAITLFLLCLVIGTGFYCFSSINALANGERIMRGGIVLRELKKTKNLQKGCLRYLTC